MNKFQDGGFDITNKYSYKSLPQNRFANQRLLPFDRSKQQWYPKLCTLGVGPTTLVRPNLCYSKALAIYNVVSAIFGITIFIIRFNVSKRIFISQFILLQYFYDISINDYLYISLNKLTLKKHMWNKSSMAINKSVEFDKTSISQVSLWAIAQPPKQNNLQDKQTTGNFKRANHFAFATYGLKAGYPRVNLFSFMDYLLGLRSPDPPSLGSLQPILSPESIKGCFLLVGSSSKLKRRWL